eukprot:5531547-Pleurochrysis_carterae.AAC.1
MSLLSSGGRASAVLDAARALRAGPTADHASGGARRAELRHALRQRHPSLYAPAAQLPHRHPRLCRCRRVATACLALSL